MRAELRLCSPLVETLVIAHCFHVPSVLVSSGDDPRKHLFFSNVNFLRLEAGLVDPPWVPKPNVVYAKNLDEMRDTSEVEPIKFDAKDEMFFREFSTGAVAIRWQKEMIDSGVFDELNSLEANGHMVAAVASRTCVLL